LPENYNPFTTAKNGTKHKSGEKVMVKTKSASSIKTGHAKKPTAKPAKVVKPKLKAHTFKAKHHGQA